METTFITIHNTTPEANILYASESIVDILGYTPEEVQNISCFDYFYREDLPNFRQVHKDSLDQDKAAVISYARILSKNQEWVWCECVFTVVYNCLVSCTSIYKHSRAIQHEAAGQEIRRYFSSPPRDPRYHMLQHLSWKFDNTPEAARAREPRACLFLNRFTRTSPIMYATDAVQEVLGISVEEIENKSFYECMDRGCHPEAIRCLEAAKANDSIAYLRFWYRDPRRLDDIQRSRSGSSESEEGGVAIGSSPYNGNNGNDHRFDDRRSQSSQPMTPAQLLRQRPSLDAESRASSGGQSADIQMFDHSPSTRSATSSFSMPPANNSSRAEQEPRRSESAGVNRVLIEAIVSATSDGLVVIIRRASEDLEPSSPHPSPRDRQAANATLFAAPWGPQPVVPGYHPEEPYVSIHDPGAPLQALHAHSAAASGVQMGNFMQSIRDMAVFAWALTGINGNVAQHARGTPHGEAYPPTGFPVWDPQAQRDDIAPPENQAYNKWETLHRRAMGAPRQEMPNDWPHARQAELVRSQYERPYGTDAPGSTARRYLGQYIGEDGRGPAYFGGPAAHTHMNRQGGFPLGFQQQQQQQQQGYGQHQYHRHHLHGEYTQQQQQYPQQYQHQQSQHQQFQQTQNYPPPGVYPGQQFPPRYSNDSGYSGSDVHMTGQSQPSQQHQPPQQQQQQQQQYPGIETYYNSHAAQYPSGGTGIYNTNGAGDRSNSGSGSGSASGAQLGSGGGRNGTNGNGASSNGSGNNSGSEQRGRGGPSVERYLWM